MEKLFATSMGRGFTGGSGGNGEAERLGQKKFTAEAKKRRGVKMHFQCGKRRVPWWVIREGMRSQRAHSIFDLHTQDFSSATV